MELRGDDDSPGAFLALHDGSLCDDCAHDSDGALCGGFYVPGCAAYGALQKSVLSLFLGVMGVVSQASELR